MRCNDWKTQLLSPVCSVCVSHVALCFTGRFPRWSFHWVLGPPSLSARGREADDDDGLDCWCGSRGGLKQGPGGRQPWDCWGLVTDGRAGTQSPWAVPAVSSLLLSFLSHNTLSLLLHLSPLFLWIYFSDMAFSIIYHLIISPFTVLSFLFSLSWIHLFLFSSLVLFITVVDFYKSLSALSSVLVPDSFTFSLLFFFLTYESSFLSSVSNLRRCAHSRST